MTDFTRALSEFAAGPVSTTAQARIVTSLSALDWLAVGRAGVNEPVSRILRGMVLDEGGSGQATLFGGGVAPMRAAALVNGTVSHALDYDDTHFAHIGHPSVAVFPGALWLWPNAKVLPFDLFLLVPALAGMRVVHRCRFGITLGRSHYQIGFHQTATAGAFGATVAAALIRGLR